MDLRDLDDDSGSARSKPTTLASTYAETEMSRLEALAAGGLDKHLSPSVQRALGIGKNSLPQSVTDQIEQAARASYSAKLGAVAEAAERVNRSMLDKVDQAAMASFNTKLSTIAEASERVNQSVLDRVKAASSAATRSLFDTVSGTRSAIDSPVSKTLAELSSASDRLRSRLEDLGSPSIKTDFAHMSKTGLESYLGEAEAFRVPELPPIPDNPIHETNDLLRDVSGDIGALKALTAATAEVHQKQMETMTSLFVLIDKVVVSQEKAAKTSFWITMGNVALSVIATSAAIAALVPIYFP